MHIHACIMLLICVCMHMHVYKKYFMSFLIIMMFQNIINIFKELILLTSGSILIDYL